MSSEHQHPTRPKATIIEVFVGVVLLFILGPRFTSLVLLGVIAILYAAYPLYKRRSWLVAACVAYFASLLLPFDVELAGFPWHHRQSAHSGPRFVRAAGTCMPRHSYLICKYGEYVEHPASGALLGPRWIFVWD